MLNKPDFERLRRVLQREDEPDRVPFFELYMDVEVMEALTGKPLANLNQKDNRQLSQYLEVVANLYVDLEYDYVPLRTSPDFPKATKHAPDTATMPRSQREWLDEHKGLIQNREDFEKYPWPDPQLLAETRLKYVEIQARHLPENMKVIPYTSGVFENGTRLIGTVPFLTKIYTDTELIKQTLDKVGQTINHYVEALAEHPRVGAIIYNDDMGYKTGPIMNPKHFREYVFPLQKRIAEAVHKHGKPFILHSCGKLEVLMEDLISYVGIDAKHSFQDLAYPATEYKRLYGDRIAVLGGIDVDKLTRMPTPELRQHVKNVLEQCMPSGGYALGSGNTITNYVKLENFQAMLETGRKYGKYPANPR